MFCQCGSVVIKTGLAESICYVCKSKVSVENKNITFAKSYLKNRSTEKIQTQDPKIKMNCEKCGSKEMTFKSLQLRSVDEGQTIFYYCKCGFKTTVHS